MQDSHKERIDVLLVEKGLADSREKAKRIIMAGLVFVDQQRIDKPGTNVLADNNIEIRGAANPYVSRGGLKLEKALKQFNIQVKDRVWLDVGASTGGFTHCLLENEAKLIYSMDVGYEQLAWELRQNSRVIVMERTNIRYVKKEDLASVPQGAVIDVSFISLKLVLPVVVELIANNSPIIALIKPQFEVGKGKVGKNGVVREKALHIKVLTEISGFSETLGLELQGLDFSPITGPEGNIEFLAYFYKGKLDPMVQSLSVLINEIVFKAHNFFKKKQVII
ncbi:MAG: TlyA family RNA methyltransferase [Clostridia bacterium]|nr:TlyA family RNA methyltransferase [Clostridia bacterium]MDD4680299.1 TlyA family RNA methyltransferase [Clostridia bacterium]